MGHVIGNCPHCGHAIENTYSGGVKAHLASCWGANGREAPETWIIAQINVLREQGFDFKVAANGRLYG